MGIRGLDSGLPEPPNDIYEGPSVEPPVGRVLLRAWANGAPEDLCSSTVPWPQTPTSLLRPSAEPEAIGLAGAMPPISPAGPQAR
jgi:hypothetical protein